MPSPASIVVALTLASTIAPTLAVPVYNDYSSAIAKREDELFARELAEILARADESGAINWKGVGQKVWSGAKKFASVAGPIAMAAAPYAMQALKGREEQELFARLDARDQEYVIRELLEARGRKWDKVKEVGKKIGHGIVRTADTFAPIVANGLSIAASISSGKRGPALGARDYEDELLSRDYYELDAREDDLYDIVARALYDLD